MARPWWQLHPIVEGSAAPTSPCMTFPALVARRYDIVKANENDFLLSETINDLEAAVVLAVDSESKVTVLLGANATIDVQVNDLAIRKGEKSSQLKINDRLKLNDRTYALSRLSSRVADIRSSIRQLVQCSICLRSCRDPQLLRCGHSFCSSCLNQMISLAMSAPVEVHRFDVGILGMLDEQEFLQQAKSIKCGVCRQQFSCWEATRAYRPVALTESMTLMQEWIDYEETRPKCASCQDARCLVEMREYEYCEKCRSILCPVCAVEGHRSHQLRDRKAVVAAMHEAGKRLATMKIELMRLRRLRDVIREKLDENVSDHITLHNRIFPGLMAAMRRCSEVLGEIEKKAQPFAAVASRATASFDQSAKESEEKITKATTIVNRFAKMLQGLKAMLPPEKEAEDGGAA